MSSIKILKNSRSKNGQGVIEFVMMTMFFFTFFFIIVKLSLNFAAGHLAHYATFMAARAYFASHANQAAQSTAALQTLTQYLGEDGKRFALQPSDDAGGGGALPGASIGAGPNYADNMQWRWQQGVTYSFKQQLYLMPLLGAPGLTSGNKSKATFTSESWLGREPSSDECDRFMRDRGQAVTGRSWIYDNGC